MVPGSLSMTTSLWVMSLSTGKALTLFSHWQAMLSASRPIASGWFLDFSSLRVAAVQGSGGRCWVSLPEKQWLGIAGDF